MSLAKNIEMLTRVDQRLRDDHCASPTTTTTTATNPWDGPAPVRFGRRRARRDRLCASLRPFEPGEVRSAPGLRRRASIVIRATTTGGRVGNRHRGERPADSQAGVQHHADRIGHRRTTSSNERFDLRVRVNGTSIKARSSTRPARCKEIEYDTTDRSGVTTWRLCVGNRRRHRLQRLHLRLRAKSSPPFLRSSYCLQGGSLCACYDGTTATLIAQRHFSPPATTCNRHARPDGAFVP